MSSENSTASCMQKNDLKKKNMTLTYQRQEQEKEAKGSDDEKMKEIPENTKMRCRLPSTASKKVKQVTTMASVQKTSRHATTRRRR